MINFIRNLIRFSKITRVNNESGLLRAQIETQGEPEDTILYSNYGFVSNPPITDKTLGLTYMINGYSEFKYTLPFVADQIPVMQEGESSIWSIYGSKIHFKQDKDIDIASEANINVTSKANINVTGDADINITGTGNVTINGTLVNLGDATSFGLNQNAVMQVTVTGGSSAGTYPVTIVSAGNTKVKF